jgi:hypothetical protein
MTRFDGIDAQRLAFCRQIVKEMLESIEPPIDGGGSPLDLALLLDKVRDIAPGHGLWVLAHQRKKET